MVRGYQAVGPSRSAVLARQFADATAFGFSLRRHGIAALDVDSTDERVFLDAVERFGPTPVTVRTGAGHYQAYYKNSGENRRIRPFAPLPIDILGNGYVVAPPSVGRVRTYEFLTGGLEDFANLPPMQAEAAVSLPQRLSAGGVPVGIRNETLFRFCLEQAHTCGAESDLLRVARMFNEEECSPPLREDEVLRTVQSALKYTSGGRNWVGRGGKVVVTHAQVDALQRHQDELVLLVVLRRHHWGRDFYVANALGASRLGWEQEAARLARAGSSKSGGYIVKIRPARFRSSALFAWPERVASRNQQ